MKYNIISPKILLLMAFLSFFACNNKKLKQNSSNNKFLKLQYAENFKIERHKNYSKITALGNTTPFYLVGKDDIIPKEPEKKRIIRTPIKSVVCLSTTHIAFLSRLGKSSIITGVSGVNYVFDSIVNKNISEGKVIDVGYENSLDFEQLIKLKPDIVFAYNIDGNISQTINKANKLKIPIIVVSEHLEKSILGQAEWLRFFAEFVDKTKEANSIFSKISNRYNKLKNETKNIKNRSTVLLNMPWKGTWYVSGGKSNIAELINDAGADYIFKSNKTRKPLPMNIEAVFSKASQAEFWLNTGQAKNINEIIATDKRLGRFSAVKQKKIYNRNKRINKFGGNDFMESGVINPDIILSDLIKIFHPEIVPEHKFFYYNKIN